MGSCPAGFYLIICMGISGKNITHIPKTSIIKDTYGYTAGNFCFYTLFYRRSALKLGIKHK